MLKRLTLIGTTFVFVLVSGCNIKTEKDKVIIETETVSAIEQDAEEESELAEEVSEIVSEEKSEEPSEKIIDKNEWMNENGLTISMDRPFTFTTAVNDGTKDIGEINIPATVDMSTSTVGLKNGKKIKCTFTCDMTEAGNDKWYLWHGAFDRYTGALLSESKECPEIIHVTEGDLQHHTDYVELEINGKKYDVSYDSESEQEGNIVKFTKTITCPEDYEGIVFYIGYADTEIVEQYLATDFSDHLFKYNETSFFEQTKDKCYYFTPKNY